MTYPHPKGYNPVKDGDIIQKDDIFLGKNNAACGRESYGWSKVAPYLVGREYYAAGMDCGTQIILLRRDDAEKC